MKINEELPLTLYQAWLEEVDPSQLVKPDAAGPLDLAVGIEIAHQLAHLSRSRWAGGLRTIGKEEEFFYSRLLLRHLGS